MGDQDKYRSAMFRGTLLNEEAAEQQFNENAKSASADIVIARYGVRDTGTAIGLREQAVLDAGSFRSFVETGNWDTDTVPMYLDHGNAQFRMGSPDSTLKLGKGDHFRESEEENGLVVSAHYNMAKQVAREALSDLIFDPKGETFSFRWENDESYRSTSDGAIHTSAIFDMREYSQCGIAGAQADTGVINGSIRMRGGVFQHSTDTSTEQYDPAAAVKKLPGDAGMLKLRQMHAWADLEGDPERLSTYRLPHHDVDEEAHVGAANLGGVRSAMSELNTPEVNLSDADRRAAYNHLARHLDDAGETEIPSLKARMPDHQMLLAWMEEDAGFKDELARVLDRNAETGPSKDLFMRQIATDRELRHQVRSAIAEADQSESAVKRFYEVTWNARKERSSTTR